MDYGTAAVVIGAMGSVVTIILMKPKGGCPLHPTVEASQKELWEAVKEMRDDIKTLLQRTSK